MIALLSEILFLKKGAIATMDSKLFCNASSEEQARMQQYFHTLPAYVQETIHQSGIMVSSLAELQKCAENMTRPQ